MSRSLIGPMFFLVLDSVIAARLKCCEDGFVLSDDFKQCVKVEDALYELGYRKILDELDYAANATRPKTCFQDSNSTHTSEDHTTITSSTLAACIDFQKNGSLLHLECWNISRQLTKGQCDNIFTMLPMYGATMMVFANIIYLFFYVPVFLLYVLVPSICRRAYDKVVFAFFATQILLSCVVITLGHFILCHKPLSRLIKSLLGLSLEALTISSVLWLLVISLDVASTITKFRWAPSSGSKGRDENHKFQVYLLWVIIGTFLPVTISTILQFSPLPDENIFKPNFQNLTTLNYRVIVHVATVPLLVAISSNVLFIYTTVRMIKIQKSTSVANENRKKSVKKTYVLYLKLYLLMDAPYVTGALGSAFEHLWILKFCRLLQPLCMCYAVMPRNMILNVFSCKKKTQEIKPNDRGNPA